MENLDLEATIAWTHAIGSNLNVEGVVRSFLLAAMQRFRARQVGMFFCDPVGGHFLPEARILSANGPERLPIGAERLPLALASDVLQTTQGSSQVAVPTDPSLVCLPAATAGNVVAVVFVARPDALTPAEQAEFRFLASLAATSLHNARVHEAAARQSHVREVLNTNILGIVVWERGGRILEANEAFMKIVGYAGHESSLPASLDALTPDEWKPVIRNREAQFSGGGVLPPLEREFFRRDGSRAPVLVTATRLDEESLQRVTFVLDLSERRRAEEDLENARAELAHVSKVTALTALAGSIAHEINQPLMAIVAYGSAAIRWLNKETPNVDEARDSIERLVLEGHRAGAIILGILSLLKKHAERTEPLDLNALVKTTVQIFQPDAVRSKVRIQLDLAAQLPQIVGDKLQLQQLIGNLVVNGLEAMAGLTPDARLLSICSAQRGDWVEVSVRDSGKGLGAEATERIFEPLFTTKEEGLGMGLSVCKLIVEAHAGRLWVSRDEAGHTAFRFALPVMSPLHLPPMTDTASTK
ncbi:sensor histidine kinase [Cupriavidus sp. SW-Y-13]|uniref:sensor histidine kinase n=1 Tax=Cupriavidus sp. SW-Y-13 TaxID=2653854 RepID=UPI0013652EFE|nr:ATP-binding protein [Cupriavidus sp. SW-Y-13]MWL87745.1 PAS domain S-box protein [Cupriavidus sp. SW-Y-13]